jgi:hypothetical protein
MTRTTIILTALAVLLCVLVSGCTTNSAPAPAATPAPTPEPTPVPTTVAAVATTSVGTEPVQTLPAAQQVILSLTKDRPTSEIHLLYEGGPGNIYTNTIVMRVYSSPTEYKEYTMNDGKKLAAGMEIVATGTRGGDRCEVFVTSSGVRYKVMDQLVYAMA